MVAGEERRLVLADVCREANVVDGQRGAAAAVAGLGLIGALRCCVGRLARFRYRRSILRQLFRISTRIAHL